MTLAEAREDLLAQDNYDPALYKGTEYDAEGNLVEEAVGLTKLISDACVWWSELTYCNYNLNIALTLTIGEDEYDGRSRSVVSAKVLEPRILIVNDTHLIRADGKEYGLWTMAELARCRPNWRTVDDAQPDIAVWLPGNKLLLSAPPVAVYTGKNFIEGWTVPDDLVAGEDDDAQLPVPAEDHPSIVRLALDYGTLPQMEASRDNRMFRNEQWWREQAERKRTKNKNAFLGRKTRGGSPGWLYG